MKNDWLVTEIALLREKYATAPSCAELMALFPRHTPGSVRRMGRLLGLERPRAGVTKFRPGRDRLMKLLEAEGMLTTQEIGERLGITHGGAQELKRMYRSELRIAGWKPPVHMGKWAPKWGIANGMPDAPRPFQPKGTKAGRKSKNPFSVALGSVAAPSGTRGRVIKQDMVIHLHDDEEIAA
ncbi:hypothetical protein WK80_22325 [Burkholderia multivorans]|uniref:hypothetical protein n=1 Tax=Burkholderia multivorans TaxID=87883 RepID=UPI000757314B|nr:hypothetical protein [Burkholderia multivorans]KVV22328.1 hypothetical protein WK80_22325 [Burkholderia multivorans]MBU9203101.1 hypothetical protein [Burkholderia multivorans]MCA8385340.1 hypothetical protein [Burkholderia multivorans]